LDIQRAKQIVSSPSDIDVSYNGVSVWIDRIHENEKLATVHLRHSLEERSEVDISELKDEEGKIDLQ
jgi:small acid-soluble spore protein H (minor)